MCTEPASFPAQRRWRITNPNPSAIAFTLTPLNVSGQPATSGTAPPGASFWYLPAINPGANTTRLSALGANVVKASSNAVCP
jgi:hypothetical protein